MPEPRESQQTAAPDWFATTHWSVVRAANSEGVNPAARDALDKLCNTYWYPLYAYVRRKGHGEHEAQDLTQEFFARLLARNDFADLHESRGKFRAFLLAAMNHFLAKEWRKAETLKRGAGQTPLSLDTTMAEERYAAQASTEPTPERIYDRRWAETVLEHAGRCLRDEYVRAGREDVFRSLNTFLSQPSAAGDYADVAQKLNLTAAAVAKNVERLRRRYRELVRNEIAQTVNSPAELEEELRYLLEVLS